MIKNNTVLYVTASVLVLLLGGASLIAWGAANNSRQATDLATQLQSELAAAGKRVPTTDQIVHTLGDDGGAVCLDPGNALRRGVLHSQLTNGAAGPGQRPVIADSRVVQGQLLIMKVYCPDELAEFQQVVDDLKFADVAS